MQKAVSIHIDIAELVFVVSRIPADKKAEWLDNFCETLVLNNSKNEFADKLLNDVKKYQQVKSEKARLSARVRWGEKPEQKECDRMQSNANACEVMRSDANDAKEKNREEQNREEKKEEKETKVSKKKEIKNSFGLKGLVKLSVQEYEKLCGQYSKIATDDKILSLEAHKDFKKYSDHYLTLNNWLRNGTNNISYKPKQTGLFGNNHAEQKSELAEACRKRLEQDAKEDDGTD